MFTALLCSRQVAVLSAAASIQGCLTGIEPAMTGSTNQRRYRFGFRHHNGAKENRTPDLLRAKQALYQLSYDPIKLVDTGQNRTDIFPDANRALYQLSYRPMLSGYWSESNRHLSLCQSDALPIKLQTHISAIALCTQVNSFSYFLLNNRATYSRNSYKPLAFP